MHSCCTILKIKIKILLKNCSTLITTGYRYKIHRIRILKRITNNNDKGEVGGSSPPRPTIHYYLLP
jgi:hypothetical protein